MLENIRKKLFIIAGILALIVIASLPVFVFMDQYSDFYSPSEV